MFYFLFFFLYFFIFACFFFFFFFFSSRRRHTRCSRDWVQTCALPIYVDRHDVQSLRRVLARHLVHPRERTLAGPAPRRPEVDVHDATAQLGEIDLLAAPVGKRERRCNVAHAEGERSRRCDQRSDNGEQTDPFHDNGIVSSAAGASIVSPMNGGAARLSYCEHDDAPGHSTGCRCKRCPHGPRMTKRYRRTFCIEEIVRRSSSGRPLRRSPETTRNNERPAGVVPA